VNAASLRSALGDATEVEVGQRIGRFRLFNVAKRFLHAVQGAAIPVLATSFTLPIVTRLARAPSETITLFDLRTAWAVTAFLFQPSLTWLSHHRRRSRRTNACS
jgi:hypothetical protein